MVVTSVTFGLLAVAALLYSSNIPTSVWIRGEGVIIVKSGDSLYRIHMWLCHVGIVHQSINKIINRSTYTLYKTLSKACVDQSLQVLVHVCNKAHIY